MTTDFDVAYRWTSLPWFKHPGSLPCIIGSIGAITGSAPLLKGHADVKAILPLHASLLSCDPFVHDYTGLSFANSVDFVLLGA